MKTLEKIVADIRTKGYTTIPFPRKHEEFGYASEAFMDFLELPQETKNQFQAMAHPRDRGSTVGYVKRTGRAFLYTSGKNKIKMSLDDKEYVHYNEYFEKYFKHLVDGPIIRPFVNEARLVYHDAVQTLTDILREFRPEFPDIHDKFFSKKILPRFYLRFLKYDQTQANSTIAKGHYDRGAMTLALAESHQGLRIGQKDKQIEVKHRDGQALFFPGMAITDVFKDDYLKPSWHDVIQKASSPVRPGVARWSIVFFADLVNQPNYSYEKTHKPNY